MLDATLVENLRNAWGGGIEWLAPDEAAEFQLEVRPNFDKSGPFAGDGG